MTIDIIIVTLCLFCFADYYVIIYANINLNTLLNNTAVSITEMHDHILINETVV